MAVDVTKIKPIDTMTPAEAGRILHKNAERIRAGLRQGVYPFGVATQDEETGQWNYLIVTSKFLDWIGRSDLNEINKGTENN